MELHHTCALVMDTQGASHPNIQHQYYISKVHYTIKNGCLIIQEVGACLNIPVGKEFSLAPIRKCAKDSYKEAIQPPDWNLISSGGVEEGFNIEAGGVTQARRPCSERIMTNLAFKGNTRALIGFQVSLGYLMSVNLTIQ